jgi:nuclear pore complex protein Nup133
MPTTGKITYWESIASAATLNLKLQRNGVELTIAGMMSGERVIQILNAEIAGFMLAFSSGRIAYMTVRDGQGRPAITVQFLRSGNGTTNTGIFGSLRNALSSSSWHGDIAAMRAGPQRKTGERNVVVATKKGKLQSWNIHRGGHTSLIAESEGREKIVTEIKEAIPAFNCLLIENFELLDVAYFQDTPTQTIIARQAHVDTSVRLLLLVSLTENHVSHYSLVEAILGSEGLQIGNIRQVKSYSTPVARDAISNTRLYLPDPSLAFIIFNRAVVVATLAQPDDSPESQLMTESHLFPASFEDVVDFRRDIDLEIVGSGMEEPQALATIAEDSKTRRSKSKHPAVVLIARNGGVLRVAATDITRLLLKSKPLTAKSKLEQAVFFGAQAQNLINFAVRPELEFPATDVGAAALELSQEILKSKTSHIPSVAASLEQNLRKRSNALRDLAKYLKSSGVELRRTTRWRLLWDAEKMAAASIIWKAYDSNISEKPAGEKRVLLSELVEYIHEDWKSKPTDEAGEHDHVRFWFMEDIDRLDIALPWAFQIVKYAYVDNEKAREAVLETLNEANEFVVGALEGAFNFREANAQLYGLETEVLEHGILQSNYGDLPEIWTSQLYLVKNLKKQITLSEAFLKKYWDPAEDAETNNTLLSKVAREHENLIDMGIRCTRERIRWEEAQDDPAVQHQAEQRDTSQLATEDSEIKFVARTLGLPDAAIALAEKHQILPTLASILNFELNQCSERTNDFHSLPKTERQYFKERTKVLQSKVNDCFARFGTDWAEAFYELEIQVDSMSELLDDFPSQKKYLTDFLRRRPEFAKVAWIHEITYQHDFDHAATTLLNLGLDLEEDVWSKKVELSIGKLARLASRSYSQDNGILIPDGGKTELATAHDQLGLIKIQDSVYEYIQSTLADAIDEEGEVQLALDAFGNKRALQKLPALSHLLKESMDSLVKHTAMSGLALVDLLSLMGGSNYDEGLRGMQFYNALQAVRQGVRNKAEKLLLQRVIWRRCMLKDDWAELNNTGSSNDADLSERLQTTALYMTFRRCLKNRKSVHEELMLWKLTYLGLFDDDTGIVPICPQDVLGACTERLDHRFTGADIALQQNLLSDYQVEDGRFQELINKHRMKSWYESALEAARNDHREELNQITSDGSETGLGTDALELAEKQIAEKEQRKVDSSWKGISHNSGSTSNGHARSTRASAMQH